ncbi:hypothetical protein ON010_g4324 [Phytophthora cinnamomi]|nr:hypothetical protein ON010_g4324 [Phytophthora cinnamomi]
MRHRTVPRLSTVTKRERHSTQLLLVGGEQQDTRCVLAQQALATSLAVLAELQKPRRMSETHTQRERESERERVRKLKPSHFVAGLHSTALAPLPSPPWQRSKVRTCLSLAIWLCSVYANARVLPAASSPALGLLPQGGGPPRHAGTHGRARRGHVPLTVRRGRPHRPRRLLARVPVPAEGDAADLRRQGHQQGAVRQEEDAARRDHGAAARQARQHY